MIHQGWIGSVIRASIVILIVLIGYLVISLTLPLLYPFVIGWLIALFIEPLVSWLVRRARFPRFLAVTIVLALLLSLLFSLLIFIIAEIVIELTRLAEFLPSFLNKTGQNIFHLFTQENNDFKRLIDTVQNYLEKNPQHEQRISASIQENIGLLANKGTELISEILSAIGAFLSNLPYYVTVLVFITLAAFFISLDWPRLRKTTLSIIPNHIQIRAGTIIHDLKRALFGFIRAQITLISITALIVLVGLIILKVPYAFTLALIIGAIDLLPYLGVGAVFVPWIIYLFITGNLRLAIGLAIVYGIILVVRQALEPKLVASNVGIDPLVTLIALFVGLKLFGIIGLVLGPVTVVLLMAMHRTNVFKDIWNYIRGTT